MLSANISLVKKLLEYLFKYVLIHPPKNLSSWLIVQNQINMRSSCRLRNWILPSQKTPCNSWIKMTISNFYKARSLDNFLR
jgi:hypothetical protein